MATKVQLHPSKETTKGALPNWPKDQDEFVANHIMPDGGSGDAWYFVLFRRVGCKTVQGLRNLLPQTFDGLTWRSKANISRSPW